MTRQNLFSDFSSVTSEEWKDLILKDLKGRDFSELATKSYEDITIKPFYQQQHIQNLKHIDVLATYNNMFYNSNNSWITSQVLPGSSPCKMNELAIKAIEMGQNGLYFDIERFIQENDKNSIKKNMEELFESLPIENISIFYKGGLNCFFGFSILTKIWEKKALKNFCGAVDNDPLLELMMRGELPDEDDFLRVKSIMEYTCDMPHFRGLTIQGNYFHELGASTTQELAFTIAAAVEYCDKLTDLGLSYEQVAANIQFSFGISTRYFMEIAKIRAIKLLWTNITSQFFLSQQYPILIHAHTSLWNKSIRDPYTNIIRTTIESMAAIIGGCSALTIYPFDYPQCSEKSMRIAKNIHHIIKDESFLQRCSNPSSGSFYIEKLTDEVASKAWELFQNIEKQGGFMSCLASGYIQDIIEKTRSKQETDYKEQNKILVGINKYTQSDEKVIEAENIMNKIKCQVDLNKKQITTFSDIVNSLTDYSDKDITTAMQAARSKQINKMNKFSPVTHFEMK